MYRPVHCQDGQKLADDLLLSLQWILFACRPLGTQEYYFAMISGLSRETLSLQINDCISNSDMERYVVSSSKGLAEVTSVEAQETVQFIHESVRDFLLKDKGMVGL